MYLLRIDGEQCDFFLDLWYCWKFFFLPVGCSSIVPCRKFHVCSSDTVCGRKGTSVNNASFH